MEKKNSQGIDIIENADALKKQVFHVEDFYNKNKNLVNYIGAGILAVGLLIFAYKYYTASQEKEAQVAMIDAMFSFEADSLNKALKGQGGNMGLLAIANEYGGTKAGQLAAVTAGTIFMTQNKFTEALEQLEKFSINDVVLQAKAYALIGDCHVEKGNLTDAVKYYQKAADHEPNKFATPAYMIKLTNTLIENKDKKGAIEVCTKISEKYPTAAESVIAKKIKSRLEAEIGE